MTKEERIESQPESSSIRKQEAQDIARMLLKEKLTIGDRAKLIFNFAISTKSEVDINGMDEEGEK